MKKKISSTMAITLLVSQIQSPVFAEDITSNQSIDIVNETNTDEQIKAGDKVNEYKSSGKLELDLNFSMPIKYTTTDLTNISVTLKKGEEIVGIIKLGSNNSGGAINSKVNYKLKALNAKKQDLSLSDNEVSFYHLTFDGLEIGNYDLEISGDGYENTLINDIELTDSSKRILAGTSDKKIVLDDKGTDDVSDDLVINYPGVFLAGNVDSNNLVTQSDYDLLKEQIKKKSNDLTFDLNKDNKVDITDLTYIHNNMNKPKSQPIIEDTDAIINPDVVSIDISEKVEVVGDIKDILKGEESVVSLSPKADENGEIPEISEENPISIPIDLSTNTKISTNVEQVVIKSPSTTGPGSGNIVIPGAGENGSDLVINYDSSNIRKTNLKTSDNEAIDEIVVDLGQQVAVSQITINVTGGRGNKNLTEISKVEFINNVYDEIPKPKMNIPKINNFKSKTAVGNEEMTLGWEHQPNVTGYEIKVEKLNDKNQVVETTKYKTNENKLKISKVEGYATYRVSMQSLSGDEWSSGYKDEQEDYNSLQIGDTNLSTNKNDKDGYPDNADKNYNLQGWDSISGNLSESANSSVSDAYNEELKGKNNYGSDSIVELQVIPETKPEGPEGIKANGLYKGLSVSWKSHKKAKDYDLYYRKVGEGAWTKANDPNEPKYVDTNTSNNIPDNVANLNPSEKLDKDELIRGTGYTINNLEDGATYEIKMTATNHHGTGGLSQTYLGATTKLVDPIISNYKLINRPKDNVGEGEYPVEGIINVEYPNIGGDQIEGGEFAIIDNDYSTHWTSFTWNTSHTSSPIVTFDKEYEMDTIVIATRYDSGYNGDGAYDYVPVRYYDSEQGKDIDIRASFKRIRDKNGVYHYEISLPHKIKTNKIRVALRIHPSYVPKSSISEIKFYNYDNLEDDVKGLFEDNLMLSLNENVEQKQLDELTKRARTIDSYSMEYHPNQEQILKDIQRAQDLLDDVNLKDDIKILDPSINNTSKNNIGQSNNYQSLGVAVKPGDKVNIYIGSDRDNTEFELGVSQHYGESGSAFTGYNQKLKVGKNEIVIPETGFDMDYEKGGNLYLRFASNYHEGQNVSVRVSGGTEIPHLNVNNLISDETKEIQTKEEIRTYLRELKTYVSTLPKRYPTHVSTEDKINNIYKYDEQTSILNSTEIEGDKITLSLPATQVLKGITDGLNTEEEQVNRIYDTLLAWEQIMDISYSKQGLIKEPIDFDNDGDITNAPLDKLNGKSENQYFNENQVPKNRINIKYQRMFTGAFMYASSHHVGIGYGSSPSMMQGVPFKFDENGKLINTDGNLFGWGIGHEIGHVHDRPGLTYAETTNNMLALITQTFNDVDSSRVEESINDIYDKVTSGSIGVSKGTVGLGMFWQLHLAYDNDYTYEMLEKNADDDLGNDTFYAKLYRSTREKGIAPKEAGYDQVAQTFLIRSSDAVKKDLRGFFEKWGIVASPKSNEYLDSKNYEVEDKAIYYLNDESRRNRLKALDDNNLSSLIMANDTKVTGVFGNDEQGNVIKEKSYLNQKSVPLNLSVSKDKDKILGYEIIRKEATSTGTKEVVSGFINVDKENDVTVYNDIIDAVNNRTFEYKVRAYDYNLNVTETFDVGTVKVKHDGSIDKSSFKFDTNTRGKNDVVDENTGHGQLENGSINNIKDNDKNTIYNASTIVDSNGNQTKEDAYVTVGMGSSNSVIGLKYTPPTNTKKFSFKNLFSKNKENYTPISKYEVLVSNDGKEWTKAHSGEFDTTKENTIYFNENGTNDNSQLWTHNAKYVKLVSKGSSNISIAELDILGPPGDNIEIGIDKNDQNYQNGIGRLKSDYEYAKGKVIPKDSIIVMGEYTGDPAFNVPLILNENNENFALKSQVILLANLPEDSQLGEVAEGNYIYWITKEQQQEIINGENNIEGKSIKAELYRYNKLDSNNSPVDQRLVSDTFLYDLPTNLNDLPIIELTSSMKKLRNNDTKIVEIDEKIITNTLENKSVK